MSKPQEEREFKIVITVKDDKGVELERDYNYSPNMDYTDEVYDMIQTHIDAEK